MTKIDYILTGIGIVSLLFLILRLQRYIFMNFDDEQLLFFRFWSKPKLMLNRDSINKITIATLRGKHKAYFVESVFGRFKIDSTMITEYNLTNYAIRNNITLVHEEGFHGGGNSIIYNSK